MRRIIVAALIAVMAVPAFAAEAPKTDDQKALYAVGVIMARQLALFGLTPDELELVKQGLTDGTTGKTPLVDVNQNKANIQRFVELRRKVYEAKTAEQSRQFMDKAAKDKGAVKTASGLIYLPIKVGEGAKPAATDKVKVNYRGTLIDGTEFDSSDAAGKPAEFSLDKVIKCWTEGMQLMKVGGKARLVCPSDLAYGERGSGGVIPPNATLVFEVELLDVQK